MFDLIHQGHRIVRLAGEPDQAVQDQALAVGDGDPPHLAGPQIQRPLYRLARWRRTIVGQARMR